MNKEILELLHTEFDRPEATEESHLYHDLHFDTAVLTQLVWALEENYSIFTTDTDTDKWQTVKDVINYVKRNRLCGAE